MHKLPRAYTTVRHKNGGFYDGRWEHNMYWVTDLPTKHTHPHREAHPGGTSSASLQKNTKNQMMHNREAYHGRLSSASLLKNTQKPMMHDSEAHHGGRWSASRVEVGHV